MVANNTRFLVLAEPGVFPNLASRFLAGMTRRLSADWLAAYGHGVLVAETFCDPASFAGTMYRAAGWECLGKTKKIFVTALRTNTRVLLSSPRPFPPDVVPSAAPALATAWRTEPASTTSHSPWSSPTAARQRTSPSAATRPLRSH